jgi:hypothetical protein
MRSTGRQQHRAGPTNSCHQHCTAGPGQLFMTGMRPPGVAEQHHGSHEHMQQVGYNTAYPGGPLDIYSAGTGGSFEGWTVAQAAAVAHQYGVSGGPLLGHQHMVQAHHMGGHMSHHMMGQMGAHNNSNANTMLMHSWGHQHMPMPMMNHPYGSGGSPPGGYMAQGSSSRGSWPLNQQQKAGGYAGSYSNGSYSNRQPGGRGGMQGGRGSRPRRHNMLNTNPGGQWARVNATPGLHNGCVCLVDETWAKTKDGLLSAELQPRFQAHHKQQQQCDGQSTHVARWTCSGRTAQQQAGLSCVSHPCAAAL